MPATDTPTIEPMILGMAEIQQVTSFGRTFIYEAVRAGELKTFKAGRRRVATREAVADWIDLLMAKDAA